MKKLIIALIILGFCVANVSFADSSRTIQRKSKVITASEVTSTQGVVIYKITGYANAANAVFGLYNTTTLALAAASNCKVEGGEATQYDSLPTLDFGDEGLVFDTGLVAVISGAYVVIEYN